MRSLYLLRSHGVAGLSGEQVVIRCAGHEVERVPLPLLDQILVMGNLQLSTPLIRACLLRGVPIAFLSRQGWCHGLMKPLERRYRSRADAQRMLCDGERLSAATTLVAGKIANGRVLLLRLTRRQRRELVQATIDRLQWHVQQVRQARTIDRIRGLEGNAAVAYFQALGLLLKDDGFIVLGRHRRPPTSPFDALCGFGYGVMWTSLLSRIELQGLDPYQGVLHVGSSRHAALVSDLIEPLRTLLVDPFNIWLIRTRRIESEQAFEGRDGGIFLTGDGRRAWLKAWGGYMAGMVTLANGINGPRWEIVDRLVRSFVRFVYAPSEGLVVPGRR